MVTHKLKDIPNIEFRQPKLIYFGPQYMTRSAFWFSVFICINISFILPLQMDSKNLGSVRLISQYSGARVFVQRFIVQPAYSFSFWLFPIQMKVYYM